jgi:hypothetical protein
MDLLDSLDLLDLLEMVLDLLNFKFEKHSCPLIWRKYSILFSVESFPEHDIIFNGLLAGWEDSKFWIQQLIRCNSTNVPLYFNLSDMEVQRKICLL